MDIKLYTTEDLVALFGVHPITINRWIKRGWLPPRRFGKRYLWTQDDLDALIEAAGQRKKKKGRKSAQTA